MKLQQLKHVAEISANLAVILTLIILVFEVRANTAAIQQQQQMNRVDTTFVPFLDPDSLKSAYTKVKAVDGNTADVSAFMELYQMNDMEAIAWVMHLQRLWNGFHASFTTNGPSEALSETILSLLQYPDQQLFFSTYGGTQEFMAYVQSLQDGN